MVAHDPLYVGRWTLKRFNATVVNDIWPDVVFFSLVATMVSLVSEKTVHKLAVSNSLLTVLGTVLGLVISFRTSSAYERYSDGRKMWTNITIASRNLAQMIWIHVPNTRLENNVQTQTALQSVIEKKTMISLIQAFVVSVKHYLRDEEGVYYEDLYPLISFLPQYTTSVHELQTDETRLPLWYENNASFTPASHESVPQRPPMPPRGGESTFVVNSESGKKGSFTSLPGILQRSRQPTFDPERALPIVDAGRKLKPARNPPPATIYDYIPLLLFLRWCYRKLIRRAAPNERRWRKPKKHHGSAIDPQCNVALQIILELSNYTAYLMRKGLLQPALASSFFTSLNSLQDTLANLERIRNTPLPFAYQAHLRMTVFLYLLFLPFQIYSSFHYLTIPGTAFTSYLLLGFLEIGQQIENPFNYDLNDLDLDYFCLVIERELHQITAYTNPEPADFLYNMWNQPLAPADRRSAQELTKNQNAEYHCPDGLYEPGMDGLKRMLLKNWRDVETITRKYH